VQRGLSPALGFSRQLLGGKMLLYDAARQEAAQSLQVTGVVITSPPQRVIRHLHHPHPSPRAQGPSMGSMT